jgi:hypothetical protein
MEIALSRDSLVACTSTLNELKIQSNNNPTNRIIKEGQTSWQSSTAATNQQEV